MASPSPHRSPKRDASESLAATAAAAPKRVRLQPKEVTVVVGGRTFQHYGDILCCTCDYFDGALNSSMKESETKRFTFPDRDPVEWEVFSSLLEPLSSTTVDDSNVEMLLPWADMLGATKILSLCDAVFSKRVAHFHEGTLKGNPRESFARLIEAYGTACQYRLMKSKQSSIVSVARVIAEKPEIANEDLLARLLALAPMDEELFLKCTWDIIKKFLPESLKDHDPSSLLSNKILAPVLASRMQGVLREKEQRAQIQRLQDHARTVEESLRQHEVILRDLPVHLSYAVPRSAQIRNGTEEKPARFYTQRLLRKVIHDKVHSRSSRGLPRFLDDFSISSSDSASVVVVGHPAPAFSDDSDDFLSLGDMESDD